MSELTPDKIAAGMSATVPTLNKDAGPHAKDAHGDGHGDKGGEKPKGWRRLVPPRFRKTAGEPVLDKGFTISKGDVIKTDSELAEENRIKRGTQDEDREKIRIPEHVRNEYHTILTEYANNLVRLSQTHPEILDDPMHQYEKNLLQKFAPDGRVDGHAIEDFMTSGGSGDGMAAATLIIEQQLMYKAFGMGLDIATSEPGAYKMPHEFLGKRADQFLMKHPSLRNRPWATAALAAGAAGAAGATLGAGGVALYGASILPGLLEGLGPMGIAGVAGGVAGAIGGSEYANILTKDGRLDMTASANVLNAIKNGNPAEADYLKIMTGVDVADYIGTGSTITRVGIRPRETVGEAHQVDSALRMNRAINDYRETLGYDKKRGRSIDRVMSRYHAGSANKLVTTWESRFVDLLGVNNPDSDYYAATHPTPPATPNPQEITRIMMKTRVELMEELLETQSSRNGDRNRYTEDRLNIIRKGKEHREEKGAEEWGKARTERAEQLKKDKGMLEAAGGQLAIEKKPEGAEYEYTGREKTLRAAYESSSFDMNDDIRAFTEMLDPAGADISIRGTTEANFAKLRQDARADYETTIEGIHDETNKKLYVDPEKVYVKKGPGKQGGEENVPARREAIERARDELNARIEQITEQERKVKEYLQELEALREKQEKVQKLSATKERDAQTAVITTDHEFVTQKLKLTDDDLRKYSVDELMYLINVAQAGTGAPPPGGGPPPVPNPEAWPEDQNNVDVFRRRVYFAKAEAMAKDLAPYKGRRGGVTHEHRLRAFKTLVDPMQDEIDINEAIATRYNKEQLEKDAEIVIGAAERESETINRTFSTDENVFSMRRLQDVDLINAGADYEGTKQEQDAIQKYIDDAAAAGHPNPEITRAHMELYKQIFKYDEAANRGEMFEKVIQVLPFSELNDLLNGANIDIMEMRPPRGGGPAGREAGLSTPARVRQAELLILDMLYDKYSILLTEKRT